MPSRRATARRDAPSDAPSGPKHGPSARKDLLVALRALEAAFLRSAAAIAGAWPSVDQATSLELALDKRESAFNVEPDADDDADDLGDLIVMRLGPSGWSLGQSLCDSAHARTALVRRLRPPLAHLVEPLTDALAAFERHAVSPALTLEINWRDGDPFIASWWAFRPGRQAVRKDDAAAMAAHLLGARPGRLTRDARVPAFV